MNQYIKIKSGYVILTKYGIYTNIIYDIGKRDSLTHQYEYHDSNNIEHMIYIKRGLYNHFVNGYSTVID